ncbi:hypothetical protein ACFX13_030240 [Malus domestica]
MMEQRGLYVVRSTRNVPHPPTKVSGTSSIPIHVTISRLSGFNPNRQHNVMRGNDILKEHVWRVFGPARTRVRIKEVGLDDSMCDTITDPGPQRPNLWFTSSDHGSTIQCFLRGLQSQLAMTPAQNMPIIQHGIATSHHENLDEGKTRVIGCSKSWD